MPAPRPTRPKRLLFTLLVLLLVVAALEGIGWLALRLDPMAEPARQELDTLDADAGDEDAGAPPEHLLAKEALHPFLGFVADPAITEVTTARGRRVPRVVSSHGFPRGGGAAAGPAGGEIVRVWVVGGSMAGGLAQSRDGLLPRALAASPQLAGKRVVVENFAVGGYKQPQQLLTVAWMLSLGGRPDLIVNLDGYNDLVLGYTDDLADGVYPFYPRGWRWRVGELSDPGEQQAVGRLVYLRDRRQGAGRRFAESSLAASRLGTYFWSRYDAWLGGRVAVAEQALRRVRSDAAGRRFLVHGPPFESEDASSYLRAAVAVWSRSSLQMDALCRGLGIEYVHFLQPNQYDPGSKPMGRRERAAAIGRDATSAGLVRDGYPLLSLAGERLRQEGVRFHDLRRLFAEVAEPLYVDACCHVGEEGNRILAREIAARIAAGPVASP